MATSKKSSVKIVKPEVRDASGNLIQKAGKGAKAASFWGKGGNSNKESSALSNETNSLNLSFVPGISSTGYRMQNGITTLGSVMPPLVKDTMSNIFAGIGLEFSVDDICMASDNTETIKKVIEVTDMITKQADLLPSLRKAIFAGMKGARTYSQFQRDIAIKTLQTQTGIDKDSADVLLAMGGYAQRKNKIQMELELGLRQIQQLDSDTREKIDAKWGKYYNVANSRKQVALQVAQSLEKRQIAASQSRGQKKIERNAKASEVETHSEDN